MSSQASPALIPWSSSVQGSVVGATYDGMHATANPSHTLGMLLKSHVEMVLGERCVARHPGKERAWPTSLLPWPGWLPLILLLALQAAGQLRESDLPTACSPPDGASLDRWGLFLSPFNSLGVGPVSSHPRLTGQTAVIVSTLLSAGALFLVINTTNKEYQGAH